MQQLVALRDSAVRRGVILTGSVEDSARVHIVTALPDGTIRIDEALRAELHLDRLTGRPDLPRRLTSRSHATR
jgi:hypothetical protein